MKRILVAIGLALSLCSAAQTAGATPPQDVIINSTFAVAGDLSAGTTAGTFCISGAIADCGTLVGDYRFSGLGHLTTGAPNSIHSEQTLTGQQGTIDLRIDGLYGPIVNGVTTGSGRWVIAGGTGAYDRLHGEGSWTATADFTVAPPIVRHLDAGKVHWD